MVTDTFFDLQRFDEPEATPTNAPLTTTSAPVKDTLVGSAVNGGFSFAWQNGSTFVNDGTEEAPVYHLATTGGASFVTTASGQIALDGTKNGYSFAVNENKNNWEVALTGSRNTVSGDFSQGTGAYGLAGAADVTVYKGRTFNEAVNGSVTYVKAGTAADANVNVAADNSTDDAIIYTFANEANIAVGVDNNDTAVFSGGAANVTLGPAADSDSMTASKVSFKGDSIVNSDGTVDIVANGDATVTSSGTNVNIAVKEGVVVTADQKQWVFDNKSTRDNANVVIGSTGDVTAVSATKAADLRSTDGIDTAVSVNIDGNVATWDQITGALQNTRDANGNIDGAAVHFDKDGAHINNTGAVTVKSASGANAGFATLDADGVVANDVTIKAVVAGGFSTFAVDLDATTGIEGIAVENADTAINVAGDGAFKVQVGPRQTYEVSTNADDITFDANEAQLNATVLSGKTYSVKNGDASYLTSEVVRGGTAVVGINEASVAISNKGAATNYALTSVKDGAGIDRIGLKPNDEVNVTGDGDGYKAIYSPATSAGVVTLAANNARISVPAGAMDVNNVTITSDSAGTEVTVQGIEGGAVVTVGSGATYHFKNDRDRNEVSVSSGAEYTEVTLNAAGDVAVYGTVRDKIEDNAIPRKDADDKKWGERETVGGSTIYGGADDTVVSNHAQVYNDFYALNNSGVAGNTLAGYASQDDTAPTDAASAIDIIGNTALGEASHITISGGAEIGHVPINIQRNENPNATDVTINLTASNVPSSVAVGSIPQYDTNGNYVPISAAHDIRVGSAGTQNTPSYVYVGEHATGENKISATGGYNVLRHDGENRASVLGGSGNDTIRGDVHDIVSGGASADFFYDYSGYALDYNMAEGDVIIASRLASLDEVNAANIRGNGNQVGFGNGTNLLTLGNIDQNAQVHVRVAVMDNDANVMNGVRDVVLANGNGTVDATAAGTNGALVISNASRGAGVHYVIGSEGNDDIHVGAYDAVIGGAGDDHIYIDQDAPGVVVAMSTGNNSVTGWNYGFDRAAGATQLNAGGGAVVGRVFEDRLFISLEGGMSMSFQDTAKLGDAKQMHGQYEVLVDNKKLIGIRNGDAGAGYAVVDSNDEIADAYFAEREGNLGFTANVTQDLGVIELGSANYQDIRILSLLNSSKATVIGSSDRETVSLGGDASVGANKVISLGGGNDVIFSSGDDLANAGHAFYFGTGDGRDSITNFNHYRGVNLEPDKGSSDVIVLQSLAGLKAEVDTDGYTRIEFALNDTDHAVIYEAPNTFDYNNNMYHVLIGTDADGIAKIGYSTAPNYFTYDKEVNYYVGSSGEARDTLVITNSNENVEVRMDGQKQDGHFYRGIGVIDASAASNTNTTLAGSAANNMIIAGGEGTNNFLWGGAGNNTLVGGAGKDFFLYTKNANAYVVGADHSDTSGTNDIITGYDCNNDVIILSDVTLADINYAAMNQASGGTGYGISEGGVTVALNNGGSVTVDPTNQAKVTFYINDGAGQLTAFTANRDTGTWSRG